jgi:hypothetical protein
MSAGRRNNANPTGHTRSPDSSDVCLSYRERIKKVTPPHELTATYSPQVEEVGFAGLAGRLDAQRNVPGDDHRVALNDEILKTQ